METEPAKLPYLPFACLSLQYKLNCYDITLNVLENKSKIDIQIFPHYLWTWVIFALCYLPFTGALGVVEVWTFFATSDVPISAAFKDTVTIK